MSHDKASLAADVKNRNAYYRWMFDIIMYRELKHNGRNYTRLLNAMKRTEFVWVLERDRNRKSDGFNLRYDYEYETGKEITYISDPVSLLEVLVALAVRTDNDLFEENAGNGPAHWFWVMMENCGLDYYTDEKYDMNEVTVIFNRIINRTFSKTGKGGLFPLKNPKEDQRNVEIWYQMQAYIIENYRF